MRYAPIEDYIPTYMPVEDDLILENEEYQVYKKDQEVTGSLTTRLDLLSIAIKSPNEIKDELNNFRDRKDKIDILETIIGSLEKLKKEI